MRELDCGIDLDGVLYNFENDLQNYVINVQGHDVADHPLPSEGWDFWKEQWGWDLEKFLTTCNEATDAGFMYSDGVPEYGAVELMTNLKAKGHRIHIITTRDFGTRSAHNTVDWLIKYEIPYDSIMFTPRKQIVRPDIMIDDFEKNFYAMWQVGVQTWLRDQAWNQEVNDDGYRVHSLREFECRVDDMARRDA